MNSPPTTPTPVRPQRRQGVLEQNSSTLVISIEESPRQLLLTGISLDTEHVLKPSASNPVLSSTGDNVFRPSTNIPVNLARIPAAPRGMFAAIKRPSPTPSVKRNKVERLIKEHGSPPHLRVTAGGRIVPNDFTPLGSPRFAYAPIHRPNVPSKIFSASRNASFPGYEPVLPNGFVGYNTFGELCQYIDGNVIPVRPGAHANSSPAFFMPPPNWPFPPLSQFNPMNANAGGVVNGIQPQAPPFYPQATQATQAGQGAAPPPPAQQPFASQIPPQPDRTSPAGDAEAQIKFLNERYEVLRQEKIQFEREEVKYGDTWSAAQKAAAVSRKRQYVNDLDSIRKKTKELETSKNKTTNVGAFPTPAYMRPQDTQPFFGPVPAMVPPPPPIMPIASGSDWPALPPLRPVSNEKAIREVQHASPKSEPSPSSRAPPRRSHAIPIKDPRTHQPVNDHTGPTLNPASPSYEPGKPFPLTEGSPPTFVVPAPSPIETPNPPPAELAKKYPWVFENENKERQHQQHEDRPQLSRMPSAHSHHGHASDENDVYSHTPSQHQTSHSSVTTTDFFPTNTHEHSFSKFMSRKASGSDRRSFENTPMTPQREVQNAIISPMSEQQHCKVPPASPIDHRMADFLRDSAMAPTQMHISELEGSYVAPRSSVHVSPSIREEFNGKSKEYLEGYVAATAGNAPTGKSSDYVNGYCDGLKSASAMRRSDSRSTSTLSLKSSMSMSRSKTPPNTAHNLSHASSRDQHRDQHAENLRVRQNPNTFVPHNNFALNVEGTSAAQSQFGNSLPASLPRDQRRTFSTFGAQQSAFSHVVRSYSEFDGSSSPHKPIGFADSPWNHPRNEYQSLKDRLNEDINAATVRLAKPTPQRRDRVVSASFPPHPVSLNHQSGNLTAQTARIGSIPQLSYFGDDKYASGSSEPFPGIDSKLHFNSDRSTHEFSAHSRQVDGTMDDLAEMVEPMKLDVKGPLMEPGKRTSSKASPSRMPPMYNETPPASPTKSNASPKKVTSPKHRIQQLASHARDFLGSGGSCGSDREDVRERGERSRPESPDPKKMSPEEKRRWKEDWRKKFRQLKTQETAEMKKYNKDNPL
ncbi:hypothetical protein FKW77_008201 [Venturia effusa]|uniref:Uncharacterized protein n=1 Tax=Venturia effusa TaxID=50376 RepID=A0A517LFZ0_9PEZI|nr:hypothetical protein FKW77_008201 [Venturia effusa]